MSQITSQYGDSLIEGLLAGMKYQHFKEDLKLSRLQRAEYEATTGFRQSLAAINAQKAQSELIRSQLGEQHDKVLADYAKPEADARLARDAASTRAYDASATSSEQSTKFAALLQPSKQVEAEADASRAQTLAGTAKLGSLSSALTLGEQQGKSRGMAGLTFNPSDALALASSQVESLGIKDESAKGVMQSQILQGILGGVEQGKNEMAETQAKLSQEKMKNYLETVGLAAHVASYGQAGIAGASQLLGGDHPITKAASLMIAGVPQAVAKPVPESAMTKEDAKALAQELKDLHKQQRELQRVVRVAKTGEPNPWYKGGGRSVDEPSVKTAQENLADVETDIKDLETRRSAMENPQGIQNSTGFMSDKSNAWPQDIQDFMKKTGRPILVKPTPDNIAKARAEMKKLGK